MIRKPKNDITSCYHLESVTHDEKGKLTVKISDIFTGTKTILTEVKR